MFEKETQMLQDAIAAKYDTTNETKLTEAQREAAAAQAAMDAAEDPKAYAKARQQFNDAQSCAAFFQKQIDKQAAPRPETVAAISAEVKSAWAEKTESIVAAMKPHLLAMNELVADYYGSLATANKIISNAVNEFQPDVLSADQHNMRCTDDIGLLYLWRNGMEKQGFEKITGTPAASTHEARRLFRG